MEGLYLQYVGNENPRARITAETRKVSAVVREVLARFDGERERYSAASSAGEFAFARQNARILVQQADSCEDLNGADRDRFMADNFDWYMERRPGVKVMLWAHNGHVKIAPRLNGPALGRHLKDRHADAYLSVGFVLGSGAYRALDARSVPITSARFETFTFGPPAAGTFNSLMVAAGHHMFAVDLRSASGNMRKILERPIGLREGYGLVARADPLVTLERSLPATHDVLIFIDGTTPAQRIILSRRKTGTFLRNKFWWPIGFTGQLHVYADEFHALVRWNRRVVLAHPQDHVQHLAGMPDTEHGASEEAFGIAVTTEDILIQGQAGRPRRLEGQRPKVFLRHQESQEAVLVEKVLASAVRRLAGADDPGIADYGRQRLKVSEIARWIRGVEHYGMRPKPLDDGRIVPVLAPVAGSQGQKTPSKSNDDDESPPEFHSRVVPPDG